MGTEHPVLAVLGQPVDEVVTPADAQHVPLPDAPDAPTVSGELVEPAPTTVVPSAASVAATADRARGRTAVQVGIPAALVGIGSWVARLAGLDLDPGPGVDLPADVAGYFVAVLTVALAFRMNRRA